MRALVLREVEDLDVASTIANFVAHEEAGGLEFGQQRVEVHIAVIRKYEHGESLRPIFESSLAIGVAPEAREGDAGEG